VLNFHHRADFRAAARDFDLAERLFDIEKHTRIYPRVGWPERARFYRALARLHSWHPRKALHDLDWLAETPADVPVEYWNSINWHTALAHLCLGQVRSAREWLRKTECHSSMGWRAYALCKLGKVLLGAAA
jgi:hypothetical protein